ncbi:TonB-dependent receptor family protein [Undibacterium arcticum]|uniref:TonB-dependent receptor family protein n=1 Tax=Undibacterium arcticum TaxID=1762892 RepID=A0ABV7F039_9BURK
MFRWKSLAGATKVMLVGALVMVRAQVLAADAGTVPEQELPTVVVTGTMPLPGLGLPLRDVAANVQTVKGAAIERQHAGNITEYLEHNLSSVTINSAQGNPYQPDISYRGFTASPLLGTPQGLSVFQDGVRINEPFGDVVNWDLLPQSAIAHLQVMPGSNPIFGLNTLGGAIAITTKNGRTNPGGQVEISGGSFGRRTVELEQGGTVGKLNYFVTANDALDHGWADHNASRVKQLFGKVGYQDVDNSLNMSLTAADNELQGSQTIPRSFLDNRRQSYTFPDQNLNRATLWSLSGSHHFNETLQLSANAYHRNYRNENTSSNVNGDYGASDPIEARNARSIVDQSSYGLSLQLSYFGKLAAMDNQLVVGIAGDFANAQFRQSSQDARFIADRNTVGSSDYGLNTDAKTRNSNLGVFFSDTLSLNDHWSVTASGRYNHARVKINDRSGAQPLLDGDHAFSRLNPGFGVTYNPTPALTAYAAYNEGMRTPTAIELACADPDAPCSLPNSFIADPPLKPVVAKTAEFGVRGKLGAASGWSASVFRTALDNDIQFISSSGASTATGYFQNVGKSRRQGLEVAAHTVMGKLDATLSYNYIDATYQTAFVQHSASNSSANANGDIVIRRGNKMTGVPQNTIKLRLDYAASPNWNIATNLLYRSAIFARGDEDNQDRNGKIAGYTVVNLDTTYAVTKHLQVFARVNNLFNKQYANFGVLGQNFFNGAGHSFDGANISNEQFIGPGAPRGAWVGLKYSWK